MAAKKYMIRQGELVYFSQKKGFISISKKQHNFKEALDYLMSDDFDEEEFIKIANQKEMDFEKESNGKIKIEDGKAKLGGSIEIPHNILNKISSLKSLGYEWKQYDNFWNRCLQNPRYESIEMLFSFIERQNLTICEDGCFIAYKGVTEDLKDIHTHTFDNSPGQIVKMPREEVAFDPNTPCHTGLHCGALSYAANFGSVVVAVKVDPANVVSVPYDCDCQKIRVCEYEVLSIFGNEKPISTTVVSEDLKPIQVDNTRKGSWTPQEIKMLTKMCKIEPKPSWKEIGGRLMRSSEACRKKWEAIH